MRLVQSYGQIIADDNLWLAWTRFRAGKGHRDDVRIFERNLEANLLSLRADLIGRTYAHGPYRSFEVRDPKRRLIHVPSVRDQVLHQAVWNILFPFFNARFSPSATSCRPGMGTSAARAVIRRWGKRRSSRFVLHADVVKCFDSISHTRIEARMAEWIDCAETMALVSTILSSYASTRIDDRHGIPLGNLTSQLFCNVAFMETDRALDARFGIGRWVRYADDLFVVGTDKDGLRSASEFVANRLAAEGLESRSEIRPHHGFEALGSRRFHGGFESVARATRNRSGKLAVRRAKSFAAGQCSQNSLRSTYASLAGLDATDLRWTKTLRTAILEAI